MTIQQSIEQLSSAVVTYGDSIIKIVELINKQNNQIDYQSINYKKNSKNSNLNSNDRTSNKSFQCRQIRNY